jgi:MFS family permease
LPELFTDELTLSIQTIVATAIPKITDHFDSLDDISWYGSAYFLTLGAFQSQWGKVYKYFPLKTSFLVAIFIFELGSLVCGVAQNSTTLIVGRAIAGLGASGIAPGTYTISAFAAEPAKRATYTGIIGASYGVAAVAGPLIGGGLTNSASWRWYTYSHSMLFLASLTTLGASSLIFQSVAYLLSLFCSPSRPHKLLQWLMLRSKRSFYIWTS